MTAALIRKGLGDAAELAALLVNELVTNAILHAGTEIDIRLRQARHRVRVEVADRGVGTVAVRDFGADASTGRGLMLVEELADDWGTESSGQGKVVWFELDTSDSLLFAESSA